MMSKLQVKILIDYAKYKRLLKMAEDLHEKRISVHNDDENVQTAEDMEGTGVSSDIDKNKKVLENEIVKQAYKAGINESPLIESPISDASETENMDCLSNTS